MLLFAGMSGELKHYYDAQIVTALCVVIKAFDMAQRMFSTEIVNSDAFLDMPSSTQALYFHLGMHCDDDGFVYPKKVIRMVGAADDDMKLLVLKKFVLPFDTGVVVVKHWRVNNFIRSDRYHPTTHREEMAQLSTDKGMVYHLDTVGIPSGRISREVGRKEDVSKDTKNANSEDLESGVRQIANKMSLTRPAFLAPKKK